MENIYIHTPYHWYGTMCCCRVMLVLVLVLIAVFSRIIVVFVHTGSCLLLLMLSAMLLLFLLPLPDAPCLPRPSVFVRPAPSVSGCSGVWTFRPIDRWIFPCFFFSSLDLWTFGYSWNPWICGYSRRSSLRECMDVYGILLLGNFLIHFGFLGIFFCVASSSLHRWIFGLLDLQNSNALGYASIAKIQRRCCCRSSGCEDLSVEVDGNFVFEEVRKPPLRVYQVSYCTKAPLVCMKYMTCAHNSLIKISPGIKISVSGYCQSSDACCVPGRIGTQV